MQATPRPTTATPVAATGTGKAAAAAAKPSRAPAQRLTVAFPLRLTVEHPALDLRGMFRITHAFDLYEVRGAGGENVGQERKDITVDVLDVTPTRTTLQVTPGTPMPYEQLATEVEALVTGVAARHLGGKAQVVRLEWLVERLGTASDMRGRLKSVQ